MLRIFLVLFLIFNTNVFAEDLKKVYFGGGCFWCMEESFDKAEVVEIVYDSKITNFENLLNIFWKNIDPFDKAGQFCDKGYSYRSVAFYQNQDQKKLIEKRIKEIELQYNKSVVTYVRDFDKFYKAEDYHQNYYQTNFINYLLYKKGCGRENRLDQIWKK